MTCSEQRADVPLKIYEAYERNHKPYYRDHLGASQIGHECLRALWYSFRWVGHPALEGRVLRLFQRGQSEENWLISDLRSAGFEVSAPSPQRQYKDLDGHFGGSIDGAIKVDGKWCLLEIKTSNLRAFRDVEKKGVQNAKPLHYAQMQVYMGLSIKHSRIGVGLTHALYIIVCKDNDAIYAELVPFSEVDFDRLVQRAKEVVYAANAPERCVTSPAAFVCKWCDYKEICWEKKWADVNCRTCAHATPLGGEARVAPWRCEWHKKGLSESRLRVGCDEHIFHSDLVFLKSTDAGEGWVEYKGGVVNAGRSAFPPKDTGAYMSRELVNAPVEAPGKDRIEKVRQVLEASFTKPPPVPATGF